MNKAPSLTQREVNTKGGTIDGALRVKSRSSGAAIIATSLALSALTGALVCTLGSNNPIAILLLSLSLIPAYCLMLLSCRVEGQSALTLFASMYIIFSLVTPGMLHASANAFPFYRLSYPANDVAAAALIILIFNTFLLFGYLLYRSTTFPPLPQNSRLTLRPNAIIFGSALSVLALAGFFAVGPGKFLTVRRDFVADLAQFDTMLALNLVRFTAFAGLVTLGSTLSSRNSWSKFALVPTALALVVFFLTNYPLSIPRFVLFAYLIAGSVVFFGMWKSKYKILAATFYPLLLTTIFPLLSNLSRGRRGSSLLSNPLEYYVTTGDFDGFQSTINVYRWVSESGLQNGHQLFSAIFVFVPREYWPDKAISTGSVAARFNGYLFTNISCPLPAEIFADFGWFGVIFAGAILGFLLAAANAWATKAQATAKLSNLMTYGLMAGYSTILLRGSLIGVIAVCALAMLIPQVLRIIESRRASL